MIARRTISVVAAVSLAWAIASLGCKGTDRASRADEARLLAACDSLTQAFMATLKGELTLALEEGGPAHAVQVCKVTAPQLAADHSRTPGWSIRRVSAGNRNPANAPDTYEATVLARMAAVDGPPVIYEWQTQSNSESTFVYFKAIRTAELCLSCHGPREELSPDLLAVLAEEYPDDRATGFQPGDLRGAFVVKVEFPKAEAGLRAATVGGAP